MACSSRKFLIQSAQRTGASFQVVFASGQSCQSQAGEPDFKLIFRNKRGEWRVALFGHVGLLKSYFNVDLDVEGSLRERDTDTLTTCDRSKRRFSTDVPRSAVASGNPPSAAAARWYWVRYR